MKAVPDSARQATIEYYARWKKKKKKKETTLDVMYPKFAWITYRPKRHDTLRTSAVFLFLTFKK